MSIFFGSHGNGSRLCRTGNSVNHIKGSLLSKLSAVLMTALLTGAGILMFSVLLPMQTHAVGLGTNIRQGDTIELKAKQGNAGTTAWDKEYIVLHPTETNTGEPGTFLLQKRFYSGQEAAFDPAGTSNTWEGSNAQAKCTEYYTGMPDVLKGLIIGVRTSDTGAVGANNIDGTRTGENAATDKTFALSFAEYYKYRDHISNGFSWWLRSPDASNAAMAKYVGSNQTNAASGPVSDSYVIRPAFNLALPADFCATSRELTDGTREWVIDLDQLEHSYGTPVYTWSGGGEKCTAKASCGICGKSVKEKAYAVSELASDGSTICRAEFTNPLFRTQTRIIKADSLSGRISAGDILRVKDGTGSTDYIVLDPSRTSTGDDGMFVLLRDSREKTAYDVSEQSNQWEGSTAQSWCTAFYRALPALIKNAVIGVQTQDTESGQDWLGVNNIDGTRSDTDKVFFLSFKEYSRYKDLPGMITGYKWLLRNYGVDCASDIHAYVGVIQENGEPKDYGIHSELNARPAFNLELPNDIYAVRSDGDQVSVWTIDLDDPQGEKARASEAQDPAGGQSQDGRSGEKKTDTGKTVTKLSKKLPKVKALKPGRAKKAFTVRWKKLSRKNRRKISGIEVQYAANKKFKKAVTKSVRKSRGSLKIKKRKSGKTYWVRVRTYKRSGRIRYVSRWSKVRKVKTR